MLRSAECELPIPRTRDLAADFDTPITVYLKLAGKGPSFLLESVTGGERLARFSFVGVEPRRIIVARKDRVDVLDGSSGARRSVPITNGKDPFDIIRDEAALCRIAKMPGLPRFAGGLVGYFGYELVRYCEPSLKLEPDEGVPEAILLHADTLVAFDHAFGRMSLIAIPRSSGEAGIAEADARLDELERRLSTPLPYSMMARKMDFSAAKGGGASEAWESNIGKERYMAIVERAKEHIAKGDIFQMLPSQRLSRKTKAKPFEIYRALRRLNPSPYLFFFDFAFATGEEPLRLIGSSPEIHVRLEDGEVTLRPIAGTRPRAATEEEDRAIEAELLADPKERAEHIMLVDLARNDLGRVCVPGSVKVKESFVVERYSHVMHIVSEVTGRLPEDASRDAIDLLKASYPAGTVTGAPKIRAMELIHEMEPCPRGCYAGVTGYLAGDGAMDTCITIRTIVMRGDLATVQAGGGVVYDSTPEGEYAESLNKARALAVAVDIAERIA